MHTAFTIPRNLTHGEELVVLSRKEYEKLLKHLDEARDAFGKIARGDNELKNGKTMANENPRLQRKFLKMLGKIRREKGPVFHSAKAFKQYLENLQ